MLPQVEAMMERKGLCLPREGKSGAGDIAQ